MEEYTQEEFKQELEKIRKDYNRAKKLLWNVEEFHNKFDGLKNILDDESNWLEAKFRWAKKYKNDIKVHSEESLWLLEEVRVSLEKVKTRIAEMDVSYSNFREIKGNISSINSEIQNLKEQSLGLKDDIQRAKSEAQEHLENIDWIYSDFQSKIKDMTEAYQSFISINEQIENEETWLEAILNSVKSIKNKSNTLFKEIQDYKDEANNVVSEINRNKLKSDELEKKISENLESSNSSKAEIEKITGLITDVAFHERFDERKKELAEDMGKILSWKNIFLWSLSLLAVAVIFLQTPWSWLWDLNIYEAFFSRLLLTSPLIGLSIFSWIQYGKERDLLEKYAFKWSASVILRHHIDYLTSNEFIDDSKISDFSIETFSMIYNPPYEEESSGTKRIKKLEDRLLDMDKPSPWENLNHKEVLETLKELKKLLPDESTFEKVASFFVKK